MGKWPASSWPPEPVLGQGPPTEISSFEDGVGSPAAWDILRWFERSRTDSLGGPQNLGDLQEKSNMFVVVARIGEFVYDIVGATAADRHENEPVAYTVRSSIELNRR